MKNLKCYVMMISEKFPSYHSKKEEPTDFIQKIKDKIKKTTFRVNYEFWKYRIDEVDKGNAFISVRTWKGRPRMPGSRQIEQMQFNQGEIGIQKAEWNTVLGWLIDGVISDPNLNTNDVANNDGLTEDEFKEWFDKLPKQAMGCIHFTDFRY